MAGGLLPVLTGWLVVWPSVDTVYVDFVALGKSSPNGSKRHNGNRESAVTEVQLNGSAAIGRSDIDGFQYPGAK